MTKVKWDGQFHVRLKKRREELLLTQAALADKAEITPVLISKYESGETTPRTINLTKLAEVLNVSVNYLVGRIYENPEDMYASKEYTTLEDTKTILEDIKTILEEINTSIKELIKTQKEVW